MTLCKLLMASLMLATTTGLKAEDRALWGSILGNTGATYNHQDDKKLLLTWRMLPGDTEATAFDLYLSQDGGTTEMKVNSNPILATNYQISSLTATGDLTFRLTRSGDTETIGRYTMSKAQYTDRLPYISIPLKSTEDASTLSNVSYEANDISVGDLDGDGQMEIVVKRVLAISGSTSSADSEDDDAGGDDAAASPSDVRHTTLWDAYKLDGTFMWRILSGPSILTGNSASFAIADFDGDGKAEMAIKTGEGTIFGDGTEIGDTDGDGITDYRSIWAGNYNGAGPEFLSVIDGTTGRELDRADYIDRGTSLSWGDNYWKRANSHRIGVAHFLGDHPSIFVGRGVYGRTVAEAWDYRDGELTRLWHFDTDSKQSNNKDGKPNSAYAGQGNHSFNAADLDGDGYDEIMYGSMALDHDGTGLWSSGLGHGDANHVGKFLPDREGLQVWHCLETGTTTAALHDAATGEVIWKNDADDNNDTGRCMVADIDPNSPGCEMWWAGSDYYSATGSRLGDKPSSCNMAIWWDGTLNRQLINAKTIDNPSLSKPRVFTIYRYDMEFINSTKSNPGWYGDMLGDWREEVIVPDATKLKDIKVFSTWYTTEHRFPWLMTDHTYLMSALNENVGYNQPTHTGFYLGSDLKKDSDAWPTGIEQVKTTVTTTRLADDAWYTIQGQRVSKPAHGIYIKGGRKVIVK